VNEGARFKAFEVAAWNERASTYEQLVARATAMAIEPLLDAARVTPGHRVLDAATGLGAIAAAAAARGAQVTGVDLAERMLATAQRRHPQIDFVYGDVEDLPFADASFDAVVAGFVVNHLPAPERGAAELTRVVRPGGRVATAMWGRPDDVAILGLPHLAASAAGLEASAAMPPGPSSLRFTDAEELSRLLRGAGLEDVAIGEVAFTLPVANLDELWDGVLGGTVRTSAVLRSAQPAEREIARAALARLAQPHRRRDGYELPITIRVAAGQRPAGY
jgi:SAM-dependent methyltransferase